MKNEKIRNALDRSMADMTWKEANRAQVLRGIRQEQPPVRVRRRALVPVLALALQGGQQQVAAQLRVVLEGHAVLH